MKEEVDFITGVADSLLKVPGYIEDVAKCLVRCAQARASDSVTLECQYEGIVLHVRRTSTVEEVKAHFHHERLQRFSERNPEIRRII